MRVLLDNNILVSSLISPISPPAQLAQAWRQGRFELVTSTPQIIRLADVLSRPKIRRLVQAELADQLIVDLIAAAILVDPHLDIAASVDPEDNIILGTAVAGQADLIVTGDKRHLLPLGRVQGIPIVTAAEAMNRLEMDTK